MNKAGISFAVTFFTAALLAATTLQAQERRTVEDGVYTEEQAERGQPHYEQYCAACHNAGFYEDSLGNRINQPIAWFYEEIAGTMPQNAPGSLTDKQYEDILAYILKLMDFPAGDSELDYESGEMNTTLLAAPD